MKTVVLGEPPPALEEILKRRRALGQDGFDEVWEGVYHMAPMARPWHGYVEDQLAALLRPHALRSGLVPGGAFNLGNANDYRVPDRGYHRTLPSEVYVPTAAIVVEVVSPDDETWEKFGFYAAHGVEEICTAEPLACRLRWWRCAGNHYIETDTSALLDLTVEDLATRISWPR